MSGTTDFKEIAEKTVLRHTVATSDHHHTSARQCFKEKTTVLAEN
jgi:hypothetical protein